MTYAWLGGIVDDTIVTNASDFLYVVVNAGCYERDMVRVSFSIIKFRVVMRVNDYVISWQERK